LPEDNEIKRVPNRVRGYELVRLKAAKATDPRHIVDKNVRIGIAGMGPDHGKSSSGSQRAYFFDFFDLVCY
jgi:hypothetical protein